MKRLNLPKERIFVGPALTWKRIAAFFIDMVILNFIVFLPFRSLFRKFIPEEYSFAEAYKLIGTSSSFMGFLNSVSIVMAILVIVYFAALERKTSQSIGKSLLKIYVVSDSKDMRLWQLIVRNIVFIPIFPFVLLWILDPLFMFFTKTNQRLSEILSKTRVVENYSLEQNM